MNIIKPDLSHISFLREAESDISTIKVLLVSKNYSQAAYFFEQSVEKSCKYLGLTTQAVSYNEVRSSIGHEPERVFDKIFQSEIFLSMYNNNNDYSKLKQQFKKQSLDERAYSARFHIECLFENEDTEPQPKSYCSQLVSLHDSNASRKIFPEHTINELRNCSGIPKVEILCKEFLLQEKKMGKCCTAQMIMSFLVSGVEANSRYPDYNKKTTPSEIYSKDSEFVQNLHYLIEKQEFCISFFRMYFSPENLYGC